MKQAPEFHSICASANVKRANGSFRPIADIQLPVHFRAMFRVPLIGCLVALVSGTSCTAPPHARLNATQAGQCRIRGGFESRGGFGEPFCQFRYTDGGKTCSGKADCQGECVSDMPSDARLGTIPAGTAAAGHCAAEQSLFGCYALVEGGKLVTGYECAD